MLRRRYFAGIAVVVLAAACSSSSPSSTSSAATSTTRRDCTAHGNDAHRDLRYANTATVAPEFQSLDLYVPLRAKGCDSATPLVVYVHGGAFVTGDKANKITDKVNVFTGEGWAFASLNYRLVGKAGAGPGRGMYPAAELDVAAAIAYLVGHAHDYDLDPQHVMLLGHSAGAFLVALESTNGTFLRGAGLSLDAVVCTAPLDTTYDITSQIASGSSEAKMYRNAFGNDPAVWKRGSPSENIAAGNAIPAFHIVTRGRPGRVQQSQAFAAKLRAAHVTVDVQVAKGLTHEGVNEAVGKPGETAITPPLMSFFRNCTQPA